MAEAAPKESDSMEDILQSIKRIIEDDNAGDVPPAPAAAPSAPAADVLELTQVLKADGSVAALPPLPTKPSAKAEPAPAPVPPAAPAASASPELTIAPKPPLPMEEGLVSDQAAQAAIAALKPIVESGTKDYSIPHIPSSSLRNGNTVEDLLLEALKPMLKAWLDEHLPFIVQKIVEKEVKRLVTFHND